MHMIPRDADVVDVCVVCVPKAGNGKCLLGFSRSVFSGARLVSLGFSWALLCFFSFLFGLGFSLRFLFFCS